MIKKNWFYLSLIIIYLIFLSKDFVFSLINNYNDIDNIYKSKELYYEKEYESLMNQLKIEPNNYDVIYSKIIFRDIYEFYDKITILKGEADNLKKGSVVINNDGLVGVINKTYQNYSEIQLLTNKDINISVKINESYGILTASNNNIYIKNIKLQDKINEGDKIYTSGLTKIPENILIGTVKSFQKDNLELEYIIEVTPSVNFHNLRYVGVIK